MASNGSDYIQVSPELLRKMANLFGNASHDTATLLDELKPTAQQLISDMHSGLKHSPDELQRVWDQCYKAIDSEKEFLREVARSLNTAADNYQNVDQNAIPKG